jgi:hypothetical protein
MTVSILSLSANMSDSKLDLLTRDLRRDLLRTGVRADPVAAPPAGDERGDVFSFGQLAIDLVTSGAGTALFECLKAYFTRERTLRVVYARPDGTRIEVTAANLDTAIVRDAFELTSKAK